MKILGVTIMHSSKDLLCCVLCSSCLKLVASDEHNVYILIVLPTFIACKAPLTKLTGVEIISSLVIWCISTDDPKTSKKIFSLMRNCCFTN